MKNKVWQFISVLAILSMALVACTPAATPTAAPTTAPTEAAQPTTAPTMAPTMAPTEAAQPTTAPTMAPTSSIDCMGAKSGDTLSMLYQWSGTEEAALNTILKPLADACGIVFNPEINP